MDYEAIKRDIATLIEEAKQTTRGRVEEVLEPLRESLMEARRQGVKLHKLFTKMSEAGIAISPSSFAKYSQKHLQRKRGEGRQRPTPPVLLKKTQSEKQVDTKSSPSIKSKTGKPRIATGNY